MPLGPFDTCDIYTDESVSCQAKYVTYVSIYAVFMIYFTIVGLKEQFWMQVTLTGLRLLVMALVVAACLAAALTNTEIDSDAYNPADIPTAFESDGTGKALAVILFATMYQTALPSIVEQMRNKDQTVPTVLTWTTMVIIVCYLSVGLIVPVAVRDVPSQCTMAFTDYSAGYSQQEKPWWASTIGYLIVIFPALDVFSCFPLSSVALGDNLQSLVYGSVPRSSIPRSGYYGLKLLACVPAIVVAMLEHNLSTVLDWAGLFGFFLMPFMIPMCHLAGRKVLPVESQYDVRRLSKVMAR